MEPKEKTEWKEQPQRDIIFYPTVYVRFPDEGGVTSVVAYGKSYSTFEKAMAVMPEFFEHLKQVMYKDKRIEILAEKYFVYKVLLPDDVFVISKGI